MSKQLEAKAICTGDARSLDHSKLIAKNKETACVLLLHRGSQHIERANAEAMKKKRSLKKKTDTRPKTLVAV